MAHNYSTADLNMHKQFSSIRLTGGIDCSKQSQFPDLYIKGGARIKKNICVGGNLTLTGGKIVSDIMGDLLSDTTVFGNLTVNEGLTVNENTSIIGNLNVGGKLSITGNLCVDIIKGATDPDLVQVFGNLNVGGPAIFVQGVKVVGTQEPDIANIVDDTNGVITGNLVPIRDTTTFDDSDKINDNFAELAVKVNGILDTLRNHGLMG